MILSWAAWRNGRRRGLKIPSPVTEVRVRVPPRPFVLTSGSITHESARMGQAMITSVNGMTIVERDFRRFNEKKPGTRRTFAR